MKKMLFLLLVSLALTGSLQISAQPFNTKFFYQTGPTLQYTTPSDIIADGKGYSCVLGSSTTNSAFYSKDLFFQKTDFSGNIAMRKYYRLNNTDSLGQLMPQKIVKTRDNGYIIVGYYQKAVGYNVYLNPFAAKFDLNGKFVWSKLYNSTIGGSPNSLENTERVNITPVMDDTTESYIITFSDNPDSGSTYSSDAYIHAMRISSIGNLLWHYRYVAANRGSIGYSMMADWASALTYANNGTKSMYFISGFSRYETTIGIYDNLFFFGIDKNGAIVHNLTLYKVPGYPFYVDAIYDNTVGYSGLAIAYTWGNAGPPGHSAAALTKIDLNFNVLFTNGYYVPNEQEFYGSCIKQASDNSYIIACGIEDATGPYQTNNAILKTDQSGNPVFFNRYNVFSVEGLFRKDIISYFDATGSTENYAVDGMYDNTWGIGNTNLRLFSTDPLGNTCGNVTEQPIVQSYSAITDSIVYAKITQQGSSKLVFDSLNVIVTDSICDISNPGFKNTQPIAEVSSSSISIYPNLLAGGDNMINLLATSASSGTLQVKLFTIDGKIIDNTHYQLLKGNNHFTWAPSIKIPGNYVLWVKSEDGSIMHSFQVSKL